ncbi:hypothetical protein [Parvicella tangerina]|uniref:ABM domain-containing protein n=1 Tax=Parvicella tangerina TaxID=2829795 RepID=A0A916JJX5_9FLAO|nr:hypothetical protein [Parvicella tangerina]CAG5077518.1 hypothetical protein CRYO30217_00412 [Parvicella tangerina]
MKKLLIGIIALSAIVTSCSQASNGEHNEEIANAQHDAHHDNIDMNSTYTFMSISTAKPGKLDDLVRIASEPSELMDEHLDGLIARQVSVDTSRNSVVVWVAFDNKETLYNHLETEQGKKEHGDQAEMDSIIETFTMYDLSPQSQRLIPKH